MISVQKKLDQKRAKRKELDEEISKLAKEKSKHDKKCKSRAISILGRIALSKLDTGSLKDYLSAAKPSERKSLIKCISQLSPDLANAMGKSEQSKK